MPTKFIASRDFHDEPLPMHISGVREMNATLFTMLEKASDLADAGEAFMCYMAAMFGLDPEQREAGGGARPGQRRFRSSFLRLVKGWGYDSNGPEGAVFKGWVESRFGIFPTYHKEPIQRIASGAWTTYVEEKMSSRFHNNAIYTQLDLVYEFCQWALKCFPASRNPARVAEMRPNENNARLVEPKDTHVTLYRGTNSFDEHLIQERIDKTNVVMRLNNLASFSADRDVASCFGDIILTVDVPLAKLVFFNTLLSKHALDGEAEYLVIGGDYRVSASRL
jgi:NAD+--dinitrogen-reductase ADP-D-ribosyltransferase